MFEGHDLNREELAWKNADEVVKNYPELTEFTDSF